MNITRRRRAKNRLLKRRLKKNLNKAVKYYTDSVDRRIAYARIRQSYFVDYDYSVKPFDKPLVKSDEIEQNEGEDLVNIDAVETLHDR